MVFAIAGRKLVNAIETVKSDKVYLNISYISNINNIYYIYRAISLYYLSGSSLIFREFKGFIIFQEAGWDIS
jgi:hypothetical protein